MQVARFSGWVFFVALAAQAGLAQESPDDAGTDGDNEIVVESERIVDIGVASEMAEEIAARPASSEPLARFRIPLCLTLATDDPERGQEIGQRIIANARAAGLEVAKPGCSTNALLVIADDIHGQIEQQRSSGGGFFFGLKRHQIDRAMKVSGPVYVFHDIVFKTNVRGQVDRNTKKNMMNVAMMMEKSAAAQFSARQIADYASLSMLAPAREMAELASGPSRTVLTLFSSPETALAEMSALDREYLSELYRRRANGSAVDVLLKAARAAAGEGELP